MLSAGLQLFRHPCATSSRPDGTIHVWQVAVKNDWRSALRAYAALAVLRQAALCLAHYGFQCAQAYMCQVLHRTSRLYVFRVSCSASRLRCQTSALQGRWTVSS